MIKKWSNSEYGGKDAGQQPDMWGVIKEEVDKGWYVPSKGEWAAFLCNLSITSDNYIKKGLPGYCWSSSLGDNSYAWIPFFSNMSMGLSRIDNYAYLYLSTTF